MYGFVSLSSPHLGFLYNTSTIIDAGLWFLKNWTNSETLKQLSMTDHPDLQQTFLYKLSETKGLSYFKQIIFIGSF